MTGALQGFYAPLLLFSAGIAALVAAVAWRRRPAPGALGLFLLESSVLVWSLSYALQWMLTDRGPSLFWLALRDFGAAAIPACAVVLVLDYTGRSHQLTRTRMALLLSVPFVGVAIAATDPLHGLYLGGQAPVMSTFAGGLLRVALTLYLLAQIIVCIALLLRAVLNRHHIYRLQAIVLLLAFVLPFGVLILERAKFHLDPMINATPLVFAITGPLLAFAMFRLGLLTIVPVARDRLIEDLQEGVIVVDSQYLVVDMNPAATLMTGVTDASIGSSVEDVFSRWPDVIKQLHSLLEGGGGTAEPRALLDPDRLIETHISPLRRKDNELFSAMLTFRDVTERATIARQLEAQSVALSATMERSILVLAAISDGILLVGQDERLLGCNPAASRILGANFDASEGTLVSTLSHLLPLASLAQKAAETAAAFTEVFQTSEGRQITVEVIPLFEAGSGEAQTLFVLRDETERQGAERMQRDFVANVSHELRTPLTGLSLLAETLPQAVRDDPEQVEGFVSRLRAEVRRVIRITDELMTLSYIENLELGIDAHLVKTDLSKLVNEIAEGAAPLAAEKQQDLTVDAPAGLFVTGDETSLEALVGSLLENAIRYTPTGGHVTVRTQAEGDSDGCTWAVLSVSDDGMGISAVNQERIFERFFRVDKARSRTTGGTGLGLSIAQRAAELHGGTVEIQSKIGVGSTFTVRIPVAR
ncbi:MAG: histidine kinase N-terminal 7TM domain-containing protein [Coriobacteriia bacterium]